MYFSARIVNEVQQVARIHYIDATACRRWNAQIRNGELRLLTGWCWTDKNGQMHRQGFKTMSVCFRDAWYTLIAHQTAPVAQRHKLRVVARRAA
jgi:hypothetical protein